MNDAALLDLLDALKTRGYAFVTPTPASHARVLARPDRQQARDLAGIFGWSLPFLPGAVDREIEQLAEAAGILTADHGGLRRSILRVSALHDRLFLHSAYPTTAQDAVFFGPDSYRFADLIAREAGHCRPGSRIVDIGTGAGVGAIVAAGFCPGARVTMTDINPNALHLARLNAVHNGVEGDCVETNGLDGIAAGIDLALANPPFIIDDAGRAYRDGGDMHGGRISLDMAVAAADRLAEGGRLILYTGSAIIAGADPLRAALEEAMAARRGALRYCEIDPDIFGEELDAPAYRDVDRIALVAAIATKAG